MKTPDYLSYDRYKKKKKSVDSKNNALKFVVTFFITLFVFTLIAKSLSPNVDVSIGNDSETDAKESGLGVKKFIDDRLKMIQMADNSANSSLNDNEKRTVNEGNTDQLSQYTEEKVTVPTKKNQTNNQDDQDMSVHSLVKSPPPRPTTKDLSTPFSSSTMSKVLVGRYASIEQAKVAQEILLDSGLDITPFVRSQNGAYTLQVGSYSSRAKAEELVGELQRNNFPARIIQE